MLRPKRKIIISVHGIRTTGAWQKQIASVVSENGWIYYPMDYGYFTAVHFAMPFIRKSKITWFCHQFDQIKERYPDVTPSVIAHSNGTYIVANALKTYLGGASDVLDFGGGTGNLALALAARDHRVDFVERSALQKTSSDSGSRSTAFRTGFVSSTNGRPLPPTHTTLFARLMCSSTSSRSRRSSRTSYSRFDRTESSQSFRRSFATPRTPCITKRKQLSFA